MVKGESMHRRMRVYFQKPPHYFQTWKPSLRRRGTALVPPRAYFDALVFSRISLVVTTLKRQRIQHKRYMPRSLDRGVVIMNRCRATLQSDSPTTNSLFSKARRVIRERDHFRSQTPAVDAYTRYFEVANLTHAFP